MNEKQNFCDLLLQECTDSEHVTFSANVSKGNIFLVWDITFKEMTYLEAFHTYRNEIRVANEKLQLLQDKYENFHVKTRMLNLSDVEHFDRRLNKQTYIPVNKDCQTDCQTMAGFVEFKLKQ